MIRKVCRIYGATEDDRRDLFQEILLQLWKSFKTFENRSKFSTWLYRVALNTAITGLKKDGRRPVTTPIETSVYRLAEAEDETTRESIQKMYRAIGRLSEIEKALVMLYLDEHNYSEMEEILGINANNLRVKMNRLKEKLRKLMEEEEL